MPTFSTTVQYRTRVTVQTFDTMSMKITSTGLYILFVKKGRFYVQIIQNLQKSTKSYEVYESSKIYKRLKQFD